MTTESIVFDGSTIPWSTDPGNTPLLRMAHGTVSAPGDPKVETFMLTPDAPVATVPVVGTRASEPYHYSVVYEKMNGSTISQLHQNGTGSYVYVVPDFEPVTVDLLVLPAVDHPFSNVTISARYVDINAALSASTTWHLTNGEVPEPWCLLAANSPSPFSLSYSGYFVADSQETTIFPTKTTANTIVVSTTQLLYAVNVNAALVAWSKANIDKVVVLLHNLGQDPDHTTNGSLTIQKPTPEILPPRYTWTFLYPKDDPQPSYSWTAQYWYAGQTTPQIVGPTTFRFPLIVLPADPSAP